MRTARQEFIDEGFSRLATLGCPNFDFFDKAPQSGDNSVEALFEEKFEEMLEHIRDFTNGHDRNLQPIYQTPLQAQISHFSILKEIEVHRKHIEGLSRSRAESESGVDDKLKATTPKQQKAWTDHERRAASINKYALDMTLAVNELARKNLHDVNELPDSYIPLRDFLNDKIGVSTLNDEAKGAAEKTIKYKYQLQEGDLNTAWWRPSARKAQAMYRKGIGKPNESLFDGGTYFWWLFGEELELKVGDYIDIEITEHPAKKAGESSRFTIKVHDGLLHLSKLGNPDTLNNMTYNLLKRAGVRNGLDSYSIHRELKDNVKDVLSFAKWMLKKSSTPPFPDPLLVTGYLEKLQDPKAGALAKGVVTPEVLGMVAELKEVNDKLITHQQRLAFYRSPPGSPPGGMSDDDIKDMISEQGELTQVSDQDLQDFEDYRTAQGVGPLLDGSTDQYTQRYDFKRFETRTEGLKDQGKRLGGDDGNGGKLKAFNDHTTALRDRDAWVDDRGNLPPQCVVGSDKHRALYQHKESGEALSKDLENLIRDCESSLDEMRAAGRELDQFHDDLVALKCHAEAQKEQVDDVLWQLDGVDEPLAPPPTLRFDS